MNLPMDFVARMNTMLGSEYSAFEQALGNNPVSTGLRINTRKSCAKNEMKSVTDTLDRVSWCDNGYYCDKTVISGNHPYHIAGLCYFQEPSAMASVEALKIKPGDYVLDLCAAPGGKATQAGAYIGKNGLLVANEIIPKRAAILAENIERLGISNSIVTNESPERLKDKFPCFFDKIIVDAPCSGEGMFKKEPQAVTEWSINHTKTCAVRQAHIMDCAYQMLRPGGSIVYSTCTFAPCENEGIADYMLKSYDDLSLADTGLDGLDKGVGEWAESSFDLSLCRRIFPHHQRGEGHFIALFKKNGSSEPRRTTILVNQKQAKAGNSLFKEFEAAALNTDIRGSFTMFGDNLYLVPDDIDTDGLKVVRGGLHLGICKKNRFEPSHALASALSISDFKQHISFSAEDTLLKKYLRGETIPSEIKGYCCIAVGNAPIGWAKGSDGVLKNRFPKQLRLP